MSDAELRPAPMACRELPAARPLICSRCSACSSGAVQNRKAGFAGTARYTCYACYTWGRSGFPALCAGRLRRLVRRKPDASGRAAGSVDAMNDAERRALWQRWCDYGGSFPPECADLTCGARTRAGTPCKRRDLYRSGRCKLHGGLSTGPRTAKGKRLSARNAKRTPKSEPHGRDSFSNDLGKSGGE